ncbi:MAG: hypothetical protein ABIO67_04030 [Mycobacteriales bacterium]
MTITKRDEGPGMAVYDEQGNEIDESRLESGDVVFDENGEAIQLFSDEAIAELLDEGYTAEDLGIDEDQLVGVGKGLKDSAVTGGTRLVTAVRHGSSQAASGYRGGRMVNGKAEGSAALRAGNHLGRNRNLYATGAAAGTAGEAHGRFKKSLGEQVLSDLSKALTDGDRDQVISKMADRVSQAETVAKAAQERAEALESEREFERFVDVAKSFELPIDPEDLGGILQEVSKVLTDGQLETLERIFNTAASAVTLDEAGSAGYSPLMGYVDDQAMELVGKSDGGFSPEQATTALFSANDDAYLAYLSENQR